MPHLHSKGIPRDHCGTCTEDCPRWDGIFCDVCAVWYHFKCEQLEKNHQDVFKDLSAAPYICKRCRSDEKGVFSFTKSLERLHKGSKEGIEKLVKYVAREKLFMKEFSFHCVRNPKYSSDVQAQALLQEYCSGEKKNAAKITRDNNSLFSAVSVALTGNEKQATELRVRCCIEMVAYETFYKWQENFQDLSKCAPEYYESCLNCATPDEDSCVWTMSALASVVRRCIQSIYPAVNGKMDTGVETLNRVFVPRIKIDDGENIKIFWSSSKKTGLTPGSWVPDMFVPLVEMLVVPLSPMVLSPFSTPSRVSGRVRKPSAKVLAFTSPKLKNQVKVTVENTVPVEEDDSDNDSDFEMTQDYSHEPTDDDSYVMKHQSAAINLDWMDKYDHDAVGGKPLRGTSFLPAQEVFKELTSYIELCPKIPTGRKEDVFYVIDNSRNMRYKNRRNTFHDDCGRYNQKSGTTCKTFYLLNSNNTLQQLARAQGLYCKDSKRVSASGIGPSRGRGRPRFRGKGDSGRIDRKVTQWIPLDPQPDESKIIVLHRYYSCLDIDPTYRRRISWLSNVPSSFEQGHNVFLAEYVTKPVQGLILPKSRKSGHKLVKMADKKSPEVDSVNITINQTEDASDEMSAGQIKQEVNGKAIEEKEAETSESAIEAGDMEMEETGAQLMTVDGESAEMDEMETLTDNTKTMQSIDNEAEVSLPVIESEIMNTQNDEQ